MRSKHVVQLTLDDLVDALLTLPEFCEYAETDKPLKPVIQEIIRKVKNHEHFRNHYASTIRIEL